MEAKTTLELPLTIFFTGRRKEPATRHYPGCPAYVEINDIEICGLPVHRELLDALLDEYHEELTEVCFDAIREERQ